MSNSTAKRWLAIFGLGYVLLMVGLTLIKHGPSWLEFLNQEPSQNSGYAEGGSKHNEDANGYLDFPPYRIGGDRIAPPIRDNGDTPISNPKEQQRTQREKDDLKAQQDMAKWAMLMFVSTLLSVIVTGFGVWYVRDTLHVTKDLHDEAQRTRGAALDAARFSEEGAAATLKAAEAAIESNRQNRDSFLSQQRAWLTLDLGKSEFESSFIWDEREGRVDVNLVFQNFGVTPAYKANLVNPEFIIGSHKIDEARLNVVKSMAEVPLNVGYTVMPNEALPQGFTFSISTEMAETYIKQAIRLGADERYVDFGLFIVGCMTYELAFKNERRNTPFVVGIARTRDNKWMSMDPRPELGEVSFQDLRFERWPVGDISPE